jgi:hypothetical protein
MNNEPWNKSSNDTFTIKYNGESVESNEMDASELATSLLGMSSVLENANTLVNGKNSKIFVKVRGSFKPGSFDVDIVTFFTFAGINAAANVVSIVGFAGKAIGTLIWLFKKTKGNKIVERKVIQGNNIELKVEGDNNSVVIIGGDRAEDVVGLHENPLIRRALANFIQPLKKPGMSDITLLKNGVECEKILKEEADYFSLSDTELLNEKEDIDDFLITRPDFEGRQTGWRLSHGESEPKNNKPNDFPVKILDEDFLNKVKQNEIDIHQGTIIRAKYKKITQKMDRLSVAWEILQVIGVDSTSNKLLDKYQRKLG